jgi:hypothetical protein
LLCNVITPFLDILTPEALREIRRTRRLIRHVILEETQDKRKAGQKEREREREKARGNLKDDAEAAEATIDRVRERMKRERKARLRFEDEERARLVNPPHTLKLSKFAVCVDAEVSSSKEPSVRFGDGLWVGKRLFTRKGCHHIPDATAVPTDHPLAGEDLDTIAFVGGSFLVEGLRTTQDKVLVEQVLEFLVRGR